MYCSSCGQAVNAFQPVCPRCGNPITAPPLASPQTSPVRFGYSRVGRNLQTMGILWLAYAAWSVIGWLIALPFLAGAFGGWGHHWGYGGGYWGWHGHYGPPHTAWLAPLITVIVIVRAALYVAAGLGLLQRARWARTLTIVMAFLTLIKPIAGTILAIYTLWVLLPSASGQEYDQIAVRP